MFEYRIATMSDLADIWQHNIDQNHGDHRWVRWRDEYIAYNRDGAAVTFVAVCCGRPVGECTLLLSPKCSAVGGRQVLADGVQRANINALRVMSEYRGQGHATQMVHLAERFAASRGISVVTIGVEERELRNRAIYTHWGYTEHLLTEVEDGETVLYYGKRLL